MLTEADMIRIMTENYGAVNYGVANNSVGDSQAEESIDRESYEAFDDGDPYDQLCHVMSKPGDHTD